MVKFFIYVLTAIFLISPLLIAEDWPVWRGAHGDGISREKGLTTWPARGLKELWRAPLGVGFSGMSIADDTMFTMMGDSSFEYCVAVDATNGRQKWQRRIGALYSDRIGYGPRATPAIADGKVYLLSGRGELWCLDAATGKKIWHRNIYDEFAARRLEFGVCTSPILYHNLVLLNPGGDDGNSIVALDKNTGKTVWRVGDDLASYSTPVVAKVHGQDQAIFFTALSVLGIHPGKGTILWRHDWDNRRKVNVSSPIVESNRIFVSSEYNTAGAVLQIDNGGDSFSTREIWRTPRMQNHYSTCILWQGHIYGFHKSFLKCVDFATGKETWTQRGFDKGFLLGFDGHMIVFGEKGALAIAELNPQRYVEKGRFRPFLEKTRYYTVPSISNGRLFVRSQKEAVCYDLTGRR